jgi:hypothetical protein
VEQVAELVVLENIHNSVGVFGGFHHTEETIHCFLLVRVFIGNAKIEESFDFFWEGRKLHENVLLISKPEESLQIYLGQIEELWVRIVTD